MNNFSQIILVISLTAFAESGQMARRFFPMNRFRHFVLVPLLTLALLPAARAGTWNDGTMQLNLRGEDMADFNFADRAFSSDSRLFYPGPEWFRNALSGSMSARLAQARGTAWFLYDRAGDPVESTIQYNGYVGTLHDVFDVGLFNNISTFVGSGSSKASATSIANVATDSSWKGTTGTTSSPSSGSWDVATNWTPTGSPSSDDSTVLRFGGSGTSPYASTNDLGNNDGFIFGSIILNSSASVTEVINGENVNGRLAVGQSGSSIQQNGSGAFNFFNQINSKDFGTGVLSSTTLNLTGNGSGVVTVLGEINDRAGTLTPQSQNLGILKDGSSTFILTGTNTYSRGTTVNGGTLLINNAFGSGTGSGTVIVNNGGTLGGDGTVSVTAPLNPLDRLVTINDGGTVAPGAAANTVGALTLNATRVVFNAGSTFLVDLSGTLSDVLHTSGVLDLSALSNNIITFAGSVAAGINTYTLATYNGVDGLFEVQNNLPSGYELVYGPTSLLLTNDLTVVPEPSTWIGGALALIAVGFLQRHRFARMISRRITG